MTKSLLQNSRFITVLSLLLLFTVFVLQNAETVSIQLLFWSFSLPRALMIIVVLLVGIVIGWLWSEHLHYLRQNKLRDQK
jgi:uncharacterized integral membrane protein